MPGQAHEGGEFEVSTWGKGSGTKEVLVSHLEDAHNPTGSSVSGTALWVPLYRRPTPFPEGCLRPASARVCRRRNWANWPDSILRWRAPGSISTSEASTSPSFRWLQCFPALSPCRLRFFTAKKMRLPPGFLSWPRTFRGESSPTCVCPRQPYMGLHGCCDVESAVQVQLRQSI
jgi:hypothetical protein